MPEEGAAAELAVELHGVALGASPFNVRVTVERQLTFGSAFDTNGVLYHIGTAGGTEAYRNPHEAGRVVAALSSIGDGTNGSPEKFVQHQHSSPVYNYTENEPGQWMSVDLGEGRSLRPNHYCLRHSGQDNYMLRNWRLEGSHDGSTWVALRTHNNDTSIAARNMATAAWPVEGATEAFRHFRVLQTGNNSSGSQNLMCACIELYGTFQGPAA